MINLISLTQAIIVKRHWLAFLLLRWWRLISPKCQVERIAYSNCTPYDDCWLTIILNGCIDIFLPKCFNFKYTSHILWKRMAPYLYGNGLQYHKLHYPYHFCSIWFLFIKTILKGPNKKDATYVWRWWIDCFWFWYLIIKSV